MDLANYVPQHWVLKSQRYFNMNILNTLIYITPMPTHLWKKLTGFYVIQVWFSNRRVIVLWLTLIVVRKLSPKGFYDKFLS